MHNEWNLLLCSWNLPLCVPGKGSSHSSAATHTFNGITLRQTYNSSIETRVLDDEWLCRCKVSKNDNNLNDIGRDLLVDSCYTNIPHVMQLLLTASSPSDPDMESYNNSKPLCTPKVQCWLYSYHMIRWLCNYVVKKLIVSSYGH